MSQDSDQGNRSLSDHEGENLNASNENEDETSKRIDPTIKKVTVRKPIPTLNPARLKGPKGIHTIENYFEGFEFDGKGYEKSDLNRIMKRLEHWAHRLFPKYRFDDFLEKTEALGSKKELQTFITKYRRDMLTDDVIIPDNDNDEDHEREKSPERVDEFDLLIAEQIEKNKQLKQANNPPEDAFDILLRDTNEKSNNKSDSPSQDTELEDEIRMRIERNRQMAIQRRKEKLKKNENMNSLDKLQSSTSLGKTSESPADQRDGSLSNNEVSKAMDVSIHLDKSSSQASLESDGNQVEKIIATTVPPQNKHNQWDLNVSKGMEKESNSSNTTDNPISGQNELDDEIDKVVNQFMNDKR